MAAAPGLTEAVLYDVLVNYLVSMARVVESAMNRALDAITGFDNPRTAGLPGEVFLFEPRINEMEIMIDEHAIRLLRRGGFSDDELRLIVAALKITNDFERIGDIAVNLAERVISLRETPDAKMPDQLAPMTEAVRSMVSRSLGALIFRNADLATQVLESDDVVDQYRDQIFETLLHNMTAGRSAGESGNAVCPSHAASGAHRGSRHQHRGRHYFLGARAGCAAWTRIDGAGGRAADDRWEPMKRSLRIHTAFIRK